MEPGYLNKVDSEQLALHWYAPGPLPKRRDNLRNWIPDLCSLRSTLLLIVGARFAGVTPVVRKITVDLQSSLLSGPDSGFYGLSKF